MNKEDLYDLLDEVLDKASKKQIKEILIKVIDKIPSNRNKEILSLINESFSDEIQDSNIKDLDEKIEKIEANFELIDNYELQFRCETYATG